LPIADLRFSIGGIVDERELQKRTKQFALRVMKLVDTLPPTPAGRAIANQLVRSGTSVAANYRAACRGRSPAEFIAKLGTVEEEADESSFWLELIMEGELLESARVRPLHKESGELLAIMAASRITASRNRRLSIANRKSAIGNQHS
jgi:four helix bundle protein